MPLIKPFALQRYTVAAQERVSRHAIIDIEHDFLRDHLVYKISSYVMAHQLGQQTNTRSVQVPATWWQAFKLSAIQDGNPFFRKENVKMRTITLTTNFVPWVGFPELDFEVPKEYGSSVIYIDSDSEFTK